jgi:hypothetical protein
MERFDGAYMLSDIYILLGGSFSPSFLALATALLRLHLTAIVTSTRVRKFIVVAKCPHRRHSVAVRNMG